MAVDLSKSGGKVKITGLFDNDKFRDLDLVNYEVATDGSLLFWVDGQLYIKALGSYTISGAAPASQSAAETLLALVFPDESATSGVAGSMLDTARKIIASSSIGVLPIAMASPPTVTVNTSSTITGPTATPYTDPLFRYLGTTINTTVLGGYAAAGHIDENSYRGGGLMEVCFTTDAPQFEILSIKTGDKYRIFIDDQAVTLTPAALGSGEYSAANINVDLTTSVPRRIRFECQRLLGFGGVKIPNNYSIWKTSVNTIRGLIIGDSYTDAQYGDGTNNLALGFSRQLGFKLGIPDWFVSGQSGEGYTNNGNNSAKSLTARSTTDIINIAPNYLVICEGINDAGKTPATVQSTVTSFYNAILTALPNTVITVVGPFRAPSLNPATNIFDAIRLGVSAVNSLALASKRIMYIDTLAEVWQSGTGKVGSTSGTGNSNIYIGADGVHPVQAGHNYLASKTANASLSHLAQLI